jgi:hypothetical protein
LTTGKAFAHVRGLNAAGYFMPEGLQSRWFQRWGSIETPLVGGFLACLKCGLVWSHVSPEGLRAIIEKQGTDEAKQRLPK